MRRRASPSAVVRPRDTTVPSQRSMPDAIVIGFRTGPTDPATCNRHRPAASCALRTRRPRIQQRGDDSAVHRSERVVVELGRRHEHRDRPFAVGDESVDAHRHHDRRRSPTRPGPSPRTTPGRSTRPGCRPSRPDRTRNIVRYGRPPPRSPAKRPQTARLPTARLPTARLPTARPQAGQTRAGQTRAGRPRAGQSGARQSGAGRPRARPFVLRARS